MARKPTKTKKTVSEKITCIKCERTLAATSANFYLNNNPLFPESMDRWNICKHCMTEYIGEKSSFGYVDRIRLVLALLNKPLLTNLWLSSEQEWEKYIPPLSSFPQYKGLTFADSDYYTSEITSTSQDAHLVFDKDNKVVESETVAPNVDDKKNEEDVLRMLRYDPFEGENKSDKRHLYNKLVDFLDESTLEDSFKLPAVIEIVKAFNQLDKINNALSVITSDPQNLATNVGSIKSLIDAKEKMLKSVLALAKDNGISVNHNNNKSKGAGTLSGIIKQLQERGIGSSEINVYDIETCSGMQQVADISNKSIFEQLMLNENDYTEMIKEQREMIIHYEKKVSDLDEENRLLKIKIKQYKKIEQNEE